MHEELWAAVEFKLENARFYLEQMSNDLSPAGDARTQISVAIQSTGAIMGNLWQKKFYAHLDAFLAMTRSTPDIIQSCFGADPRVSRKPLKDWFSKLDPMERKRRENFQSQFKKYYENFSKLPLSRARVATFHSAGTPPVEVKVTGRWGDVYIGSPLKLLPYVEMPHIIAGEDTSLQWAATQPPLPVEPTPDSFVLTTTDSPSKVVRKPLFPECKAYLQKAQALVEEARKIYQPVHHDKMLTPQPTN